MQAFSAFGDSARDVPALKTCRAIAIADVGHCGCLKKAGDAVKSLRGVTFRTKDCQPHHSCRAGHRGVLFDAEIFMQVAICGSLAQSPLKPFEFIGYTTSERKGWISSGYSVPKIRIQSWPFSVEYRELSTTDLRLS